MNHNRYHKFLRTSAVLVLGMLIFDGGYVTPLSKELSDSTISYLANSISVSSTVEENQLNVLTAQIQDLKGQLAEREIPARTFPNTDQKDYSIYILSTILFILTVLIVLNYILDWARVRRMYREEQNA